MERRHSPAAEGSAPPHFRDCPAWAICLLGLMAWQGWLTLSLFGNDAPWETLLDDQPIVSGRHPLHLYHGCLGAQSFRERGSLCCYDPAYQAGYPKTPVFDSGSRLGELFLTIAGGEYRPAAYKVGLALCILGIPLLIVLAARGFGLGPGPSFLAGAAGILVSWSGPGRGAVEAGDLDLLMAGLALLAELGLLVQMHRAPGILTWLGVVLCGSLGWLANPLAFAAVVPLVLIFYLSVGARHSSLGWHAALLIALLAGIAINGFWLVDWVKYWWIRAPLALGESILPHRTFHTIWNATLWGDAVDRGLVVALAALGFAGIAILNQNNNRPAARLLGFGYLGLLALAVLGIASEPLGKLGTAQLLTPALWLACVPAAQALSQTFLWLGCRLRSRWCPTLLAAAGLGASVYAFPDTWETLADRYTGAAPLAIGLGPERERCVDIVTSSTGPEARILWEDIPGPHPGQLWTSLLALRTGRSFLGGLDPDVGIEHGHASFVDQKLAGRHILHWSDDQLEEFCRRYNVGWIVCWSEPTRGRIAAWKPKARPLPLPGNPGGFLFNLGRPAAFALEGTAQVVQADCQHITLADVVPDRHGSVVLSFHFQAGMQASPSRVHIERENDAFDPIPLIRLRMSGPVARVTLTWEGR